MKLDFKVDSPHNGSLKDFVSDQLIVLFSSFPLLNLTLLMSQYDCLLASRG